MVNLRKHIKDGGQIISPFLTSITKDQNDSMVYEGAISMFLRSTEKYGLHYTSFVGGGDSSTYGDVIKMEIFSCNRGRMCWSCTEAVKESP